MKTGFLTRRMLSKMHVFSMPLTEVDQRVVGQIDVQSRKYRNVIQAVWIVFRHEGLKQVK